jgi:hypothetical protein
LFVPLTAHHIQDSIDALKAEGTVAIIAHRLSTVKNADRVYVLDDGRVIERETYHELRHREDGGARNGGNAEFVEGELRLLECTYSNHCISPLTTPRFTSSATGMCQLGSPGGCWLRESHGPCLIFTPERTLLRRPARKPILDVPLT